MARKILRTLTNNFWFKVLAVALAFIFWLIVYNIEDPVRKKTFTTIVYEANTNTVTENQCYEVLDGTNQVSFSVSAKRSVLEKLDDSDFTATADFEKMILNEDKTKGTIHVDVTCNKVLYAGSINIVGNVKNLEVSLENRLEKRFKILVKNEGEVADNCALGELKVVAPSMLKISGPESIVSQIETVVSTINVDGLSEEITDEVPIELYDKEGKEIPTTKLKLSNDSATVKAEIFGTKSVPIHANVTGTPEGDNQLGSVRTSLETVLVKGNNLNQISSIEIPESLLDITGATADVTTTIDITEFLPEGITLVNNEDAFVTVTIKIITMGSRTISVSTDNIDVIGLPDDFDLEFESAVFNVTVNGMTSDLSDLTVDEISGTIDASSLDVGSHTVSVTIKFANGKFTYNKVEVKVIVSEQSDESDEDVDGDGNDNSDSNTNDSSADGNTTDENNDGTTDNSSGDGTADTDTTGDNSDGSE